MTFTVGKVIGLPEYWVEAGGKGNDTQSYPAGNISYVLTTYDLIDKPIYVKPGIYNATLENFSLNLTDANMTLEATNGPAITIINGTGSTMDNPWAFNVTADMVNITGFTIIHSYVGIHVENSEYSVIQGNYITGNENGMELIKSNHTLIADNHIIENGMDVSPSETRRCHLTVSDIRITAERR